MIFLLDSRICFAISKGDTLGIPSKESVRCIPSQKNLKSAEFLKIDWSNYKEDITGFISEIHSITSDVLVTSPNDFKRAYETISKLAS